MDIVIRIIILIISYWIAVIINLVYMCVAHLELPAEEAIAVIRKDGAYVFIFIPILNWMLAVLAALLLVNMVIHRAIMKSIIVSKLSFKINNIIQGGKKKCK
jgi:hypothetical protein